ncbi:unnamed protein product [Ixodes hexagonus]
MAALRWLVVLLLAAAAGPTAQQTGVVRLRDVVPEDYDVMRPPRSKGEPVAVNVSVAVLNIRSVDEARQFMEADIFLHEEWKDPRLLVPGDKLVLDPRWHPDLWTPETYFKNSADGRLDKVIFPYHYMTLDRSGTVFMAARVSMKLACNMDLTRFPHDNQLCDMLLSSLIHSNDSVALHWKSFRVTKNLSLSQFTVLDGGHGDCTKRYEVGTFACLYGRLELRRRAGYYLINKYAPSTLIVAMSFVSFWMPHEAVPARVTLSVTSLLTIVTQQYQSATPGVSYVVALNVWMIACITFVFLGLVEYALVVACIAKNKAREVGKDSWWPRPVLVDRCCRLLFPAAFIIHGLIYWGVYGRH